MMAAAAAPTSSLLQPLRSAKRRLVVSTPNGRMTDACSCLCKVVSTRMRHSSVKDKSLFSARTALRVVIEPFMLVRAIMLLIASFFRCIMGFRSRSRTIVHFDTTSPRLRLNRAKIEGSRVCIACSNSEGIRKLMKPGTQQGAAQLVLLAHQTCITPVNTFVMPCFTPSIANGPLLILVSISPYMYRQRS
jgi:hypothetical protein